MAADEFEGLTVIMDRALSYQERASSFVGKRVSLYSRANAVIQSQQAPRCHTAAVDGYCRANNLSQRCSRDNKGARQSCGSDNEALCGP